MYSKSRCYHLLIKRLELPSVLRVSVLMPMQNLCHVS